MTVANVSHLVTGRWLQGEGPDLVSTDPATGQTNWFGRSAIEPEVEHAVASARTAADTWATALLASRIQLVQAIADAYKKRRAELAETISRETGKPRWEALSEVDAMAAKVPISIEAYERRSQPAEAQVAGPVVSLPNGATQATRFKAIGVAAVFGPFNFPGHLPNGHLVPAVLAGNTVVFKPSEQTPLVGHVMAEIWQSAIESTGSPPGVFNMIQGGAQTGTALSRHPGVDAIYFTGSFAVGRAINRLLADRPDKLLALEMGGNNPLIVHDCSDLDAAALLTIQSAYITAGQRCSCARRLIVPQGVPGDTFFNNLVAMIGRVRYGFWADDPEPFMGTVISAKAADALLEAQASLLRRGAKMLVEMKRSSRSPALLSPGLIDVTAVTDRDDAEFFGPLLQLIRVQDFDSAIREANATDYGLAAGLISDRRDLYERFYVRARAGVINWNRPLTGASSQLPFGGVGQSGNHRPSAYFAADYCSYPVASLEAERAAMPAQLPVGIAT
jgi:succinylglutamic semialdehyde dehydrogenase